MWPAEEQSDMEQHETLRERETFQICIGFRNAWTKWCFVLEEEVLFALDTSGETLKVLQGLKVDISESRHETRNVSKYYHQHFVYNCQKTTSP